MKHASDLAVEIQKIVWDLLDEEATAEQIERLERLLAEHEEARQVWADCLAGCGGLHFLESRPRGAGPSITRVAGPGAPLADLAPAGHDVAALAGPPLGLA